jgi:hypothetical protein
MVTALLVVLPGIGKVAIGVAKVDISTKAHRSGRVAHH